MKLGRFIFQLTVLLDLTVFNSYPRILVIVLIARLQIKLLQLIRVWQYTALKKPVLSPFSAKFPVLRSSSTAKAAVTANNHVRSIVLKLWETKLKCVEVLVNFLPFNISNRRSKTEEKNEVSVALSTMVNNDIQFQLQI